MCSRFVHAVYFGLSCYMCLLLVFNVLVFMSAFRQLCRDCRISACGHLSCPPVPPVCSVDVGPRVHGPFEIMGPLGPRHQFGTSTIESRISRRDLIDYQHHDVKKFNYFNSPDFCAEHSFPIVLISNCARMPCKNTVCPQPISVPTFAGHRVPAHNQKRVPCTFQI